VVGSCEYSDEPAGSGATELVSYRGNAKFYNFYILNLLLEMPSLHFTL
jgi:hypothetical protein